MLKSHNKTDCPDCPVCGSPSESINKGCGPVCEEVWKRNLRCPDCQDCDRCLWPTVIGLDESKFDKMWKTLSNCRIDGLRVCSPDWECETCPRRLSLGWTPCFSCYPMPLGDGTMPCDTCRWMTKSDPSGPEGDNS